MPSAMLRPARLTRIACLESTSLRARSSYNYLYFRKRITRFVLPRVARTSARAALGNTTAFFRACRRRRARIDFRFIIEGCVFPAWKIATTRDLRVSVLRMLRGKVLCFICDLSTTKCNYIGAFLSYLVTLIYLYNVCQTFFQIKYIMLDKSISIKHMNYSLDASVLV